MRLMSANIVTMQAKPAGDISAFACKTVQRYHSCKVGSAGQVRWDRAAVPGLREKGRASVACV